MRSLVAVAAILIGATTSSSAYTHGGTPRINFTSLTCPGGGTCFSDGCNICDFTPGGTYYITSYGRSVLYNDTVVKGDDSDEFTIDDKGGDDE